MKYLSILAVGAILFFASCGNDGGTVELKSEKDSLAYAIGLSYGQYLSQLGERYDLDSLDMEIVKTAMLDALDSNRTMTLDMATAQTFFNSCLEKREEGKRKSELSKFEGNKQKGKDFLEKNKSQEGVQVTASGLQYKITKKSNSGKKPLPTDVINVHYTLKNINGDIIESSKESGVPAEFPLNQVIPGWTEGMQLLEAGDQAVLYVPFDLAYGERGGRGIEPFSTLIFEIELICIGEGCAGAKK